MKTTPAWTPRDDGAGADLLGHHLRDDHRAAARRPARCSWRRCGSCRAGLVLLVAGAVHVAAGGHVAASGWRTGALALFNFGLFFPLLVVAVYRLPGGVAAAAGGLQPLLVAVAVVAHQRAPAPAPWTSSSARSRRWASALVVIRPGADLDPVGVARGRRCQRVVRHRRGAHQALPDAVQPAGGHRLAAAHGRRRCSCRSPRVVEGAPPALDRAQRRRLRLPQPRRHGARLRAVVQRHPPPPGGRPAAARPGRPVTGAALGWAVLGQSLSPVQLAGFVVTLGAIAYGASLGRAERPASPGGNRQPAAVEAMRSRPRRAGSLPSAA